MTSEPDRRPSKRRLWLRVFLVVYFGVPPLYGLLLGGGLLGLVAFPAGPWSARIYGHSCGFENASPAWSFVLVAIGLAAALLAWRFRGKPLALLPLCLWWPCWCIAAGVGLLNMAS